MSVIFAAHHKFGVAQGMLVASLVVLCLNGALSAGHYNTMKWRLGVGFGVTLLIAGLVLKYA